jgi:ribonucleoside-diphosphate reductase beta chain
MPPLSPTSDASFTAKYVDLYQKAKRLAWDPADVDLSRDRADWDRVRRDHAAERYADQILQLLALFHAGEESVTRTLSAYAGAAARAGLGIGAEMHLAAQLFEEAKHYEFFDRYFREVLGDVVGADPVASRALLVPAAPQAVLVDDLEAVSERLRREDDPGRLPGLLAEALTHYMGVVEAMLARTGYEGAHAALAARGWMPGLQEGFRLIRRDEGRHVAFGIHAVRHLVARDPALAPVVEATFARHLPNVLATVQTFAAYPDPLVDVTELVGFAVNAYGQFMAATGLGPGANDAGAGDRADALADALTA